MDNQSSVSSSNFGDHFTWRRFALFLALFLGAAFPEILFGSKTFVFRDYGQFSYPNAFLQQEAFWNGELPLWNPYNKCGIPFLAQWNTLCLYPLSLIYLLLPLGWSLGFFCLLHAWLAGVGTYFLARRWTGNGFAASVAGVAYAYNGLSISCLMWPGSIAALAWMPIIVLWIDRALTERDRRSAIIAALCGAMQMLCGSPEIALITWGFCSLMTAIKLYQHRSARPVVLFTSIVGLVSALAAAQLLPFLQLLSHSSRSGGLASEEWSLPLMGWASFFVPLFGTNSPLQGVWMQKDQYWLSSYYVSIGITFFALVGAFRSKSWQARALLLFAVLGYLLALGDQGFILPGIKKLIPQISVIRYPVKFLIASLWCLPLLAAFGIATWTRRRTEGKTVMPEIALAILLLSVIGIILWLAKGPPAQHAPWSMLTTNAAGRATFLILIAGGLLLLPRLLQKHQVLLGWFILACLGVDVLTHMPNPNPPVDRSVYAVGWVKEALKIDPQLGQSRVMPGLEAKRTAYSRAISSLEKNYQILRLALESNVNIFEKIPKVDGFYPLSLNDLNKVYVQALVAGRSSPLEDFMGVSHTNFAKEVYRWTNRPSFLPMVTAGQRPQFEDSTAAFKAVVSPNINLAETVVLPLEAQSVVLNTNKSDVKVSDVKVSAHRIEAKIEASKPGLVVIAQAFYPAWKAYVDGNRVPILKANYAFQAVPVLREGAHTLELRYEDRWFHIGLVISGLALAFCGWGLWSRGAPNHSSDNPKKD